MALPKKRTSRSKRGMRRSHDSIAVPNAIYCQCGETTLPHRICPHCGIYKGEQRLTVKEVDAGK
ncbi:MAG TPA: 50S ribosomal protein L32 [Desulfonatronum sp.]|nr:50S ribosomal protein L32 [Desulfonatronum sp.]